MEAFLSLGKATPHLGQMHSEVLLGPFWHIPGDSERAGHRGYRENLYLVTVRSIKRKEFLGR